MLNCFSISLDKLEHGWAYLTISDDKQSINYIVSFIGKDVLEELINSAIRLLHQQNSVISFLLEPEVITCKVEFISDNDFKLIIEDLTFNDSVNRYVRQILNMFDKYAYTHNEDEYLEQWEHTFPRKQLENLRAYFNVL